MAKISISLPDELKERLDTYAADTGFKRSEAVAHMITAYLEGEVESPVTATRFASLEQQVRETREYLEKLHEADPDHLRPTWLPPVPRSFIR